MGVPGTKPKPDGQKRNRVPLTYDWVEVEDRPFTGSVPVKLPAKRMMSTPGGTVTVPLTAQAKAWWAMVRRMPHCTLWSESDWHFAAMTALVADLAARGVVSAAGELRQREQRLGVTMDARRDLRIRYVEPGTATKAESSAKQAARRDDQLAERRARRERVSGAS